MSTNKKNPNYDTERIMQEFMGAMVDAFGEYDDRNGPDLIGPSLNMVSAEFGITPLKARKLLITAGVFSMALSRRVSDLSGVEMTVQQIMEELSTNAERTKLYRERKAACGEWSDAIVYAFRKFRDPFSGKAVHTE
jgi:hypothetical protein